MTGASNKDERPLLPSHPLSPHFEANATSAEVETLVGFIGDAPVDSRVRVYSNLTFTTFYELDRADVQNAMPADSHEEHGPTVVQVRASARVEFVEIARLTGDASYVAGSIRARYGAALIDAASARLEVLPPVDPTSRVYPPCGPLPPVDPTSRVYPPCRDPVTRDNHCFTRGAGWAYAC